MRRRQDIPSDLAGRAFLTTRVPGAGVPRGRLRAPDVQRPSRGVRAVGLDLSTVPGRCAAYVPRMPPGQAFSHATAAALYRIPLPPRFLVDSPLHVCVNEASQPPRVTGVLGHALAGVEARFREQAGLIVTDPVSTWCQLAEELSVYDLVAAGDYLVSGRVTDTGRDPPLAGVEELAAGVRRHSGKRGVKKLRAALARVRSGVDSRPETWLRLLLIDEGLPEPVINLPVFDRFGRRLGKPDLAYPWARMVFEYEGEEHRVSRERFRRDITRRETFEADGWRYVRVTAVDVWIDPVGFLARVRAVIAQQAALLGRR